MVTRWGRLRVVTVGALALALLGGMPNVGGAPVRATVAAKVVDGSAADWAGVAPTVAGTWAVSAGEFVYQDHLFDDTGRNEYWRIAGSFPGDYRGLTYRMGPPGGVVSYPLSEIGCAYNCTDLHQLRVAAVGDRVYFLARLNTLVRPDSTVVAIAFGDATAPAPTPLAWPFGANVRTQGSSHVLTLWGTGGALDSTPLALAGGSVAVSVEENVIEASLPRSLVPEQLRMHVGTGLWDAALNRWTPLSPVTGQVLPGGGDADDPAVFDAAFSTDDFGHWFDYKQSRTITTADLTPLQADFTLASPDVAAPEPGPGYHERVFESDVTIAEGEGVSKEGVRGRGTVVPYTFGEYPTRFHMLGRSQPYAVYVPEAGYERMTIVLHGGGMTHGTMSLQPHMGAMAEHDRSLLLSPFGRSVANATTDYGELDVLEAYDDASAHYPAADRSRTTLWGYSMGGLGVNRLAVTKPDLWAGVVSWAAPHSSDKDGPSTDNGEPNGYSVDLLDNLRNLPWHGRHCTTDSWAPYALALSAAERLEALGYEHRFRSLNGCDHILATSQSAGEGIPSTAADFTQDAAAVAGTTVAADPPRVTFKMSEAWWRPDISKRLVFDKAYWVSGLRVRDTSGSFASVGSVDATTLALGTIDGGTQPLDTTTGTMGPYSYAETGRARLPQQAADKANELRATLANTETVTFDLARMGLTTDEALRLRLEADGPTSVVLAGGKVRPRSFPDGATVRSKGKSVFVELPAAGTYDLLLR